NQIYREFGNRREVWLIAIEEEARLGGTLGTTAATPENVVALRDQENLRWERIAARVFADPRRTEQVKRSYDQARGPGAVEGADSLGWTSDCWCRRVVGRKSALDSTQRPRLRGVPVEPERGEPLRSPVDELRVPAHEPERAERKRLDVHARLEEARSQVLD